MALTSLTWEWSPNQHSILIRKRRGCITVDEIIRFMNEDKQYNAFAGMLWVIMGRVNGPEYLYDGYSDNDNPGDVVELLMMGDEDHCPVCSTLRKAVQYCPECGHQLWDAKGAKEGDGN